MSFLGSLLVAASVVAGQSADSVDPHLKHLARLAGEWHVAAKLEDVKFTHLQVVYRFVMEGKFLEATWSDMDGKHVGTEVFGWDAAAKAVRMWSYDPTALIDARWSIGGDTWTAQYDVIRSSGEKVRDLLEIKFEGDNLFSLKSTRVDTGKSLGTAVFKKKALRQAATRKDFEELRQVLAGRWVGDLTDWAGFGKKGERLTAHGEVTVTEDGNALIDKFYAGNGSGISLIVFDPGAKQIKALYASSGGSVDESVFYKNEGKWVNKGAGSNPDGTRYEYMSTITITDKGNTQTWTGPATVGGKKVDEQRDVWRRVSK